MPRTKTKINKLLEGTDMVARRSPSYIRITNPHQTVAYAFGRSDGSFRLQVRRPDGLYPDKLIVDRDEDIAMAREALVEAEERLEKAKAQIR